MDGCRAYTEGHCGDSSCKHASKHNEDGGCRKLGWVYKDKGNPNLILHCPACSTAIGEGARIPPVTLEQARHEEVVAKLETIQGEYRWYPICSDDNPVSQHRVEYEDMLWVLYENGEVDTFSAANVVGQCGTERKITLLDGFDTAKLAQPIGWRRCWITKEQRDELQAKIKQSNADDRKRDGFDEKPDAILDGKREPEAKGAGLPGVWEMQTDKRYIRLRQGPYPEPYLLVTQSILWHWVINTPRFTVNSHDTYDTAELAMRACDDFAEKPETIL